MEFPCGGRGRCKGCRIKVLDGSLAVTNEDQQRLSNEELAQGWRLACRARAQGNLRIELAQWETPVLTDDSAFEFRPRDGWGVAVDLGTTTLVAQLLDLRTARVLAVRTALNAQAKHGADIMSRVEYAVADPAKSLTVIIRRQIGGLINDLLKAAARTGGSVPPRHEECRGTRDHAQPIMAVILVGNTVMHHLFCGLELEPLSHFPFEPESPDLRTFAAAELGWDIAGNPPVHFLPCLGGFVGSDILAGILATRLHESSTLAALLDLGTNGEIVVGNRDRLLCASTAAGPAFEGARISMGMRAATGAISEVQVREGALVCHVLGGGRPRGICGSGLVDAAAAGLNLGWIRPNGRFTAGETLALAEPVALSQWDIRELQLAKGAIAAGLKILLNQWGGARAELDRVYLAGAFGNYINQASGRRIGLLDFPAERIHAAGNTALHGAKLALYKLPEQDQWLPPMLKGIHHLSLKEDPLFQDAFVEEMGFPQA